MRFWCFLLLSYFSACPLWAAWPERAISWVVPFPAGTPEREIVQAIKPRLSRELGVPVNIMYLPKGNGFVAANYVAGARPDGYTIGSLSSENTITRELQRHTPYVWAEFLPIATAWAKPFVLICKKDFPAKKLTDLSTLSSPAILAYKSIDPISEPLLQILIFSKKNNYQLQLKKVTNPGLWAIKSGQADLTVLPLGSWAQEGKKYDEFRILGFLNFTDNKTENPCLKDIKIQSDQLLTTDLKPQVAFFLPSKTDPVAVNRLSLALKTVLTDAGLTRTIEESCLLPSVLTGKEPQDHLNAEYLRQKQLLKDLNLM